MGLDGTKIIIIGAGIGGLSAALALRVRGADVTLLEQAGEITEVGAGLQISPNGSAVLRALGLGAALAQSSVRAEAVVLQDYQRPGDVLRLDLMRYAPDQRFWLTHRADLIALLADAARQAGIQVRLLQKVDKVEGGATPVVHLANGAQVSANLVIGADGLRSRVRAALNPETAGFFTKQVAWRAVVPNTLGLPNAAQLFMGPGRHLVCYPLRGGTQVNLVAVQERSDWADEGWSHTDDPANLRAAFSDFRGTAQDVLAQVSEVGLWGLFRHPVAEIWHSEGLAILGDAAHPTLPFLAQGANLALEDSWVLAECLGRFGPAGLRQYQAQRRARAMRVVAVANGNARKYHLRSVPVRKAAHMALRLGGAVAPERMVRQFDWLYRYDVTAQS